MNFFFSKVFISTISAFYIWIIGICIGAIIAAGAFSAPVIFNAQDFGIDLSRFQSGILMTQIFMKLNILLLAVAFIIAVYEVFALRLSDNTKVIKSILFVSGAISVICILLFSLYYSPFIIAQQNISEIATATKEFDSMHKQSEMVFNILFFSLSINLIFRIMFKR